MTARAHAPAPTAAYPPSGLYAPSYGYGTRRTPNPYAAYPTAYPAAYPAATPNAWI